MIIFHKKSDLIKFAEKNTGLWDKAGFVPTMGALHEGHISLIREARLHASITIASIFVNPSQFNDPSDFEKYPSTLDKDIRALEASGCDILFLPGLDEIYPEGWKQSESYDLGRLELLLEGHYRPGHFQGVCQVVHRLLDIIKPAAIYMGQKDYQQCMVVNRLIELKALPVQLHTCPTLREADGLAMSSRNMRLSPGDRNHAAAIYQAMLQIKDGLGNIPVGELEKQGTAFLLQQGFQSVDYVSVCNAKSLEPLKAWTAGEAAVVLVAAFIGGVRLIDNLQIGS